MVKKLDFSALAKGPNFNYSPEGKGTSANKMIDAWSANRKNVVVNNKSIVSELAIIHA